MTKLENIIGGLVIFSFGLHSSVCREGSRVPQWAAIICGVIVMIHGVRMIYHSIRSSGELFEVTPERRP